MTNRLNSPMLAALIAAMPLSPAVAQELIAWPASNPGTLRMIMPGMPIRPMPIPRPIPPRPGPMPRPVPPTRPDIGTPLKLAGYKVDGTITDNAARFTYTITFHNPSSRRLEGVLIMPIPANTVLSSFRMTVGGKTAKGELLDAKQASTIYENIVRQTRDPGLLELVGERMVRARVFPIEPRSNIVARMKLNQILRASGGLYSVSIPLRSAAMSGATSKGAAVRITLNGSDPIRTLYSPSDAVHIKREGENRAVISYEEADDTPKNLSVFFSLKRDPLAAGLLSYREEGEDGTFLLSLSPKRKPAPGESTPQDIVFIVDRSGSMEDNGKMEQAKEALKYCVRKLKENDRFGIVDFATGYNSFETRLVAANKNNKARALRYISRLEAAGGTNIEAALREGLRILPQDSSRMPMIFFMTDGLPTVGQTRMEELLRMASDKNKALRARLFSFGLGDDVNTLFLDKLAQMNRGARDYVRPGESIENKVSALYQKVAKPALTDVEIRWEGVDAHQVYPRRVHDIFYGGELVLMGRYREGGKGKLVVTGKSAGENVRFEYPVSFPKNDAKHDFLPRLWANLKVTHELDAVRLSGRADPEVIKSIVRLAKRYGIVTPYTSYLITEESFDRPAARREASRAVRAMNEDARLSGISGGSGRSRRAQKASGFFSRVMTASSMKGVMKKAEKDTRAELKRKGARMIKTRTIGGKTFYLRAGEWIDGKYEAANPAKVIRVRCMSRKYFDLLKKHSGLAKYLSLGERITVVYGGIVYKITQ